MRDGAVSTKDCFLQKPAPIGIKDTFMTELVGVLPVGWKCEETTCYEQDANNNGSPMPLSFGSICPVTAISCFATVVDNTGTQVGEFDWTDSFNGVSGGIVSNFSGTIDPTSGAGGVDILSVDGIPTAVPEPSSIALLLIGSVGLAMCGRKFQVRSKHNDSVKCVVVS